MKYTFKTLLKNNSRGINTFDLYLKCLIYPVAIPLAWVLLNYTRVTANQLTLAGLFVGVLGAGCSIFFGLEFLVVGFFIAMVFDFADGTLARNGRGSGEFGIFLDVVTDRAVLCAAAFCLLFYHLRLEQQIEALALVGYILAYLYGDIICYGLHIAKARSGGVFEKDAVEESTTFPSAFLRPVFLIPTRLSSPFFVLGAGILAGNTIVAYATGLLVVLVEYAREGLKFKS